jgi:hypothetical protein
MPCSPAEHVDDVPAMGDPGGEDQRAAARPGLGRDLRAGALDHLVGVECARSTSLATNSPQRILRSLMSTFTCPPSTGARERKPRSMSWPTADLVADVVQDPLGRADHPRAHAERRRGQADHAHERVHELRVGQELPVHALAVVRRDQVRLVDDHEVDRAELASALPDRLDARDRDRVLELAPAEARRVDAHAEAGRHRVGACRRPARASSFTWARTRTRPCQSATASRQIDAMTGVLPPPVGITTSGLSSRPRRWS